jgi:hypothetical protein
LNNSFLKNALNWPASSSATKEYRPLYSESLCPLSDGHGLTHEGQFDKPVPVSVLLKSGSPPTVILAIWAIIVNAVKCVFGTWFWPHIVAKLRKALSPLVTHRYSTSAIVMVSLVIWISAASYHGSPSLKKRVFADIECVATLGVSFGGGFAAKTSAAFCKTLYQTAAGDYSFISAITVNQIVHQSVFSCLLYGNQPSEALTSQVYDFRGWSPFLGHQLLYATLNAKQMKKERL